MTAKTKTKPARTTTQIVRDWWTARPARRGVVADAAGATKLTGRQVRAGLDALRRQGWAVASLGACEFKVTAPKTARTSASNGGGAAKAKPRKAPAKRETTPKPKRRARAR